LAGVLAGAAFCTLSVVTFYILGVLPGLLFNPSLQSTKVIAVVQTLEPLPLMQRAPYIVFAFWTATLVGYAYLFDHIKVLWPQRYWQRVFRLTLMIWFFSLFFFQFQGPLNLLAEPLPLFALELGFWAICALGASIIIVATTEGPTKPEPARP